MLVTEWTIDFFYYRLIAEILMHYRLIFDIHKSHKSNKENFDNGQVAL